MKKTYTVSTDTIIEGLIITEGLIMIDGMTPIEDMMEDIINTHTVIDMEDVETQFGGCSGHFSSSKKQ